MGANLQVGPQTVASPTSGREFVLDRGIGQVTHYPGGIVIAAAARDAGSTNLRKGLVMGKITASGKYSQYLDTNSDGTEVARGILDEEVDLKDPDGNARDAQGKLMVIRGVIDNSALFGIDANGRADMDQGRNGAALVFLV